MPIVIIALLVAAIIILARYANRPSTGDDSDDTQKKSSSCGSASANTKRAKRDGTEDIPPAATDEPAYVFIDVETTGLSPKNNAIVQISAIRYSGTKAIDEICTYINPGRLIPPSSTRIHGITDYMVRNAPHIEEIQQKFLDFIKDSVIVGYNTPFDLKFLDHAFHGVLESVEYLDVLPWARKMLDLPDYHLETVSTHLGFCADDGFHNALTDCAATAAVFFGLDLCKYADSPQVYHSQNIHRYSGSAYPPSDEPREEPGDFNSQAYAYWNAGERARIDGDFDSAFLFLDKARAAGLSTPWLYESYAKAYRKLKDYTKEIEILDQGIKVCGADAAYLIERKEKTIALMASQQKRSAELQQREEKRAEREQRRQLKEEAKSQSTRTTRTVAQCAEDGTIIKVFETISSASKEIGVDPKGIRSAATGNQVHAGGFRWKYLEFASPADNAVAAEQIREDRTDP